MKTRTLEKILGYGGIAIGVALAGIGYLKNNKELIDYGAACFFGSTIYILVK